MSVKCGEVACDIHYDYRGFIGGVASQHEIHVNANFCYRALENTLGLHRCLESFD